MKTEKKTARMTFAGYRRGDLGRKKSTIIRRTIPRSPMRLRSGIVKKKGECERKCNIN